MKLRYALFLLLILMLLTGALHGCASGGILSMSDTWCSAHPEADASRCIRDHAISWDQETLKNHDVGCPTAVFIAPQGNLVECQFYAASPNSDVDPFIAKLITESQSTADWKRFDTLTEAAIYGAKRVKDCSLYYECEGPILTSPDKKFVLGPVHTSYQSDHVSVDTDHTPDGWERVADVHSHPCLPGYVTHVFSPGDVMSSTMSRTIAFMVDLCTGDVHEFIPGVTKIDEIEVDPDTYLPRGSIIGNVGPAKAVLAHEGV